MIRLTTGLTALLSSVLITGSVHATTVKEMHLMCRDYEAKKFNVVTKPHAYCAGYFQSQIQSAAALCRTLKILYSEKPSQRDVIMGTASLFGTSATAKDYRNVISAFVDWADGKEEFAKKNPSLFMHNYLASTYPCRPDIPDNAVQEDETALE